MQQSRDPAGDGAASLAEATALTSLQVLKLYTSHVIWQKMALSPLPRLLALPVCVSGAEAVRQPRDPAGDVAVSPA